MGKNLFESMYLPLPSPVQQMKERGNLEEAEAYLQHFVGNGRLSPGGAAALPRGAGNTAPFACGISLYKGGSAGTCAALCSEFSEADF